MRKRRRERRATYSVVNLGCRGNWEAQTYLNLVAVYWEGEGVLVRGVEKPFMHGLCSAVRVMSSKSRKMCKCNRRNVNEYSPSNVLCLLASLFPSSFSGLLARCFVQKYNPGVWLIIIIIIIFSSVGGGRLLFPWLGIRGSQCNCH